MRPTSRTKFDKLVNSLEQAAIGGESNWDNVALASAAISLKRIADALTKENKDAS